MNYTKPLPESEDLRKLSESISRFPLKVQKTILIAKKSGYGTEVVEFLKLFHGSFESRGDLYTRTSELVMLIKEENKQPEETVLSPQD